MIAGIDISLYQGNMDWGKTDSTSTQYVWMRGAYAKTQDARLPIYSVEAANHKYPWGIYYVIKPVNTTNWKEQAQFHADLEEMYNPPLMPVCDAELDGGLAKQALGDWIFKYLRRFTELTNKSQMIYTSAYWWNAHVVRNDWAKQHLLWIAHYTTAAQPAIPADWGAINNPKTWTLWQWSAGGNDLGARYGAQSDDIDLDRFNGGPAEFAQVFGVPPRDLGAAPPQPSGWVTTIT